ncbi:uncharacterized protein EAE97_002868 [Botrytis byssoidea]|uniref:BTB domain-containing protein n=1 Tax=Botrytis byssoidea TaxID=139641 RepID=A0A9P5ITQ7_9HELO|nr:uncharacterized protein EAE97_002868 [Botrytis byssoidea]KAF7949359.1 hypothetical protein EAE97_002868 [Botrytis byssoidea]
MADQLNEYAIEATKQWNASAGNGLPKKPQSASQSNRSAVQSKSTALMKLEPDVLFTDTMGMETILLKVGPSDDIHGTMVFSIHKNLLIASSRRFKKMLRDSGPLDRNQMYSIHDTSPAVFKYFNEYLYTRRIPAVSRRMSKAEQGTRVLELCQLYVFAEMFEMDNSFLNKTIDTIQDSLAVSSTLLTFTLVKNILEHSQPESPLRKFCAANALYSAMVPCLDTTGFQWLIKNSDDFFTEFMKMLVKLSKGTDPRIRDAKQEYAKEAKIKEEELENGGVAVDGSAVVVPVVGSGVHPCQFHIHGQPGSGSGAANDAEDDEICYLLADLEA